jgi:putative transposase
MISLSLNPGQLVRLGSQHYKIIAAVSLDEVLARNILTSKEERLPIRDLQPVKEPKAPVPLDAVDAKKLEIAKQRYAIIKPLLDMQNHTREDVAAVAEAARKSTNTIYVWLKMYGVTGSIEGLVPHPRGQKPGRVRLEQDVEAIIADTIDEFYLHKQQRSVRHTYDEICRRLRQIPLEPPHRNTIYNRVRALNHQLRLRRRSRKQEARATLTPHPGKFEADRPLQIIEIDHHKLDIIVVDREHRRPIGRPNLTLGIDLFSRMVLGYHVSLDPPGAISTGLCVAHMILPKENFLVGLGIETNWPCWGFPNTIHLDNAKEFHGKMLEQACLNFGITIEYRPVMTPNYGPHIERFFRTLSSELKGVRGTTFSNPKERAEYNSDAQAVMTLDDLEKWLAIYITGTYHQKLHSALDMSPLQKFTEAFTGTGSRPPMPLPAKPINEENILMEFLPYAERTIQHYGVQFENIRYWSDVLRPYVESPGKVRESFKFRYDPRDMSKVYFLDPITKAYTPIPYRSIDRPAMSIWELRETKRILKKEHVDVIDHDSIFNHQESMRKIEEDAAKTTRQRRLSRERKKRHGELRTILTAPPVSNSEGTSDSEEPLEPFEDLQQL